jgi:hypothetical protein
VDRVRTKGSTLGDILTLYAYAKLVILCLVVSTAVTVVFATTYYGSAIKTEDAHRIEVYLWRDATAKCYNDYTKLLGEAQTLSGKYQELLKAKGDDK